MKNVLSMVVVGMLVPLGGCASAPSGTMPHVARRAPMAVVVTERDNGGAVRAQVGDTIEIHLAENGSTGYRWEAESVDSRLFEAVEAATKYPSGSTGSGGEAEFRIKVRAAGSGSVLLKCWRPWEGDDGVLKRFVVKVEAT